MDKDKVLGTVFGVLYYIFTCIFFLYFCIFGMFAGIIYKFSSLLFNICYVVMPIILLLFPLIYKLIFKNKFYKSIIYSVIALIIYLSIVLIVRFSIVNYFKTFTIEKWSNSQYYSLRYIMIDDLEKKYDFIGMNKEDVYNVLGSTEDTENSYEEEKKVCYFIRGGFLEGEYYCLYFDENNIVIKTSEEHWD